MLPYRYTSNDSLSDAADCAKALGVRYDIVPIAEPVEGFGKALGQDVRGPRRPTSPRRTSSRRVRGTALMAISNKFGGMVLTTGNKSEMSVGYATLYGDMNGGFNPDQGPLQDGGLPRSRAGATRTCPRAARGRAAS